MFLRRHRKNKKDETYEKEKENIPEWGMVNLSNISVENIRQFGDTYLALLLWKKLELDKIFEEVQLVGNEEIEWKAMFCLITLARFCAPSSELEIAESWYEKTMLPDILGIPADKVNDDRLYRTLDRILPHKDEVCKHLQKRYENLFGTKFDFLLYDVTTMDEIVDLMEEKYGKANRVWVFDGGIVSKENLDELRQRKAQYLVGTPRSMLKQFEASLTEEEWEAVYEDINGKIGFN